MARVLIVDDEENIRLVLRTWLSKDGYETQTASSGDEALLRVENFRPDVVLLDVRMPKMGGLEFLAALRERPFRPLVIVMSAYGSMELALEAMKAGAYDYLAKPFRHDEVELVLRKAEERESLRRENAALRRVLEVGKGELLGSSAAMTELRALMARVAPHRSNVLVLGETGSGKRLVAHALHELSDRASGPLVTLDCATLSESLAGSQLFGHKRGAFTGAEFDYKGVFDQAHGGSLLALNVASLPLSVQASLLRTLQEGRVRPLGSAEDHAVDVRCIATSSDDLKEAVATGVLREDLFYRLDVVRVQVPPLRARGEDIALLAEHLLAQIRPGLRITPEALEILRTYSFPGNVRELRSVLESASVSASDVVTALDLPNRVRAAPEEKESLSIKTAQRSLEISLIGKALLRTGGNKTAAAKLLELSPKALLYKLRDYGFESDS